MTIIWETHQEEESALQSKCGLFTAFPDPVYGYYRLYSSEDSTVSLGEGTLREVTVFAQDRALLMSPPMC